MCGGWVRFDIIDVNPSKVYYGAYRKPTKQEVEERRAREQAEEEERRARCETGRTGVVCLPVEALLS